MKVVGGVTRALEVLKSSAQTFRDYEAHHLAEADAALGRASSFAAAPGALAGQSSHDAEAMKRLEKAKANGAAAEMCEAAASELEAAVDGAFAEALERPKAATPPPSPAVLFRLGFAYGGAAASYEAIPEELRPEGPPPALNWEDAWAVVRAQLALEGK